ncbi:UDP-2,4-diacetamido-2,4,6-trideoxy-beta-L-altropyranose hydrolase [Chromobacterium phragmitis]|uniref:UDP-2,4-diacetamido-2,4, 6-trideoxy-beta-L-altropyranose hydrolase n=2 Tax=Chromobacterium phragmitis TaxID=2202141 RepID=A0A344UH46_9NEIS|nr:UDP-2,4-diacetamido-2,4,6-trideoxy-beta-L-altropyranose hydrolase [Chromobacterium phragmitis]
MRRILLRADAGPAVGGGHLMRCLALLDSRLREGADVALASRALPPAWRGVAERAGCRILDLDPEGGAAEDAAVCLDWMRAGPACGVVVDHYGLDAEWERPLRLEAAWLLALDDMADRRHDCDLLLDQNDCRPGGGRYLGKVPADCALLLGPRYALLRPEFAALRADCVPRSRLGRALVFLSSGDAGDETGKALRGIAESGLPLRVDVVTGDGHPDPAGIGRLCAEQGWTHHHQIGYMARLVREADVCVGSAGSASWERCALGLPALVAQLADNQAEVCRALEHAGAARVLGFAERLNESDYAQALLSLRPEELSRMSKAAFRLVDGLGARRVWDVIAEWE